MLPQRTGISAEPLQNIVERLAEVIGRSVAVDDGELKLLAHSTHFGDEDQARVESLVGRSVTPERAKWARQVGVLSSLDAFLTPSAPELGVRARYVAPVRVDRELVAILWIIDDGTLSEADIASVDRAVEDIRTVLVRRAMIFEDDAQHVQSQVLALLSDRAADRIEASEELTALGSFRGCASYSVFSLRLTTGQDDRSGVSVIPARVVERALLQRATGITVARTDTSTIVIAGYALAPAPDHIQTTMELVLRAVDDLGDGLRGVVAIGSGSVVTALSDVVISHDQAELAVRVARARALRYCAWDDAGLDGMLASLLPATVMTALLPRCMVDAMNSQSIENMLAVRTFLENAGNVVKTSAVLHLHRTTVYYRLSRFTQTTGLDLDDGATRLMVHLWFAMQPYVAVES